MILRPLQPAEAFYRFNTPRWFQKGYVRGEWDELWADWHCEWRRLALYEEIEPPSWLLGDCDRVRFERRLISIDAQRWRKQHRGLHTATRPRRTVDLRSAR